MSFIYPDWPAPARVKALSTTRRGGVSHAPFDSFNLGDHVGDDPQAVAANRAELRKVISTPRAPAWLQQVHGNQVVMAGAEPQPQADASFSRQPGQPCVIMTADCLPVLFCDQAGSVVAAAHAGWRGLANGVLEQTLAAMQVPAEQVLVWLGPAIGPQAFEVGQEVKDNFVQYSGEAEVAFRPGVLPGKYWADLYLLARQRLALQGVQHIYGGNYCTFSEEQRFFSYRRDKTTGRMATLIWLTLD